MRDLPVLPRDQRRVPIFGVAEGALRRAPGEGGPEPGQIADAIAGLLKPGLPGLMIQPALPARYRRQTDRVVIQISIVQ